MHAPFSYKIKYLLSKKNIVLSILYASLAIILLSSYVSLDSKNLLFVVLSASSLLIFMLISMASSDADIARLSQFVSEQKAEITALQRSVSEVHNANDASNRELRSAIELLEEKDSDLDAAVEKISCESLSLDILVVFRTLKSLWNGENALKRLEQHQTGEHGHEVLMASLVNEEQLNPGTLAGKTLIEIGTTRERILGQRSTQKLSIFTMATNMEFLSVDMDPKNTASANRFIRYVNPTSRAVTEKGEDFLREYDGDLDYIYLDAFDFYHEFHTESRKISYKEYLQTEITDESCWHMHNQCAETIIERMPVGGIVALDDTWTTKDGEYGGKGKLAAPLLLNNGFEVISSTKKTLCLKRTK